MSSIMKGIVDESEEVAVIYIDGKPSAKYAKKHEAERDAEFMRKRHPNKKIEIKHEVRETEAKKGADGKRCWKGKRYAGTENGKDKCVPVKNEAANPAQQAAIAIAKKKKAKTNEGVIVGHDANDPEIAVLGGAGTMSLSRLKKKAQGEAEQLASDLARGRFKAAAYNIKQLENTLKTIVAAEDEMSKKYFGENAWNQLGQRKPNTNLPAPERGSRVNHGKRFEEGDIVLPLSGPLKGQPHKVIHSQRTSIRIVPLGRDSYPGDTIAPRTKHEWVIPADMNEDYTGEFAAEKTPAINPYGGLKDKQHRGAISETPTDNPTGASGDGGWRKYKPKSAGAVEEAKKSEFRQQAEQQQLEKLEKIANSSLPHWAKEYLTLLNDPKGKVFKAAYYSFPKGQDAREEAAQYIMNKYKVPQHMIDKVNHGEMAHVAMDRPEDRNYDFDVPSVHEDTAYAGGMGQGHSGESYRKFKPKSAGTFKESAILKGINSKRD